ncbi:MAG: hypothetical protein ABSG65_00610 [Bryobacteraceae bacterium]|jgi:hypothetical protein
MSYYHAPGSRRQAPQSYGVTTMAGNLLQLAYSMVWAGARQGRALLERAIWMDHSPGCPRGGGQGCGCHDCGCHVECLPPVYTGCCRTGNGGHW